MLVCTNRWLIVTAHTDTHRHVITKPFIPPQYTASHAGTAVSRTTQSQWKNLKSDPCHPKMPEPMVTKIGRGDYVPDIYSCAKLH